MSPFGLGHRHWNGASPGHSGMPLGGLRRWQWRSAPMLSWQSGPTFFDRHWSVYRHESSPQSGSTTGSTIGAEKRRFSRRARQWHPFGYQRAHDQAQNTHEPRVGLDSLCGQAPAAPGSAQAGDDLEDGFQLDWNIGYGFSETRLLPIGLRTGGPVEMRAKLMEFLPRPLRWDSRWGKDHRPWS